MARPTKTLRELVRDRSFLARRHGHLLDEAPPLEDPVLRHLQELHQAETSELERHALALRVQRACRDRAVYLQTADELGDKAPEDAASIRPTVGVSPERMQEILSAPPSMVRLDRRASLRQARAQQAQWRFRNGIPLQTIADALDVSRGTVTRDLEWWWRTLAAPGQRAEDYACRASSRAAEDSNSSEPTE